MEAVKGMVSMVLILIATIFTIAVLLYLMMRMLRSNSRTLSDGYLFTCGGRKPIHVNNLTDARILAMMSDTKGINYTVYPIKNGIVGIPFHSDMLL